MPAVFNLKQFEKLKAYEMSRRPYVETVLNHISTRWKLIDDVAWQVTNKLDGYLYVGNRKFWFDIKNVKREYEKIFAEDRQNYGDGWLHSNTNKKNVLIIYCFDTQLGMKAVIFLLHKLRKLIKKNNYHYSKTCPTGWGYLVPVADLPIIHTVVV